MHKYNYNDKNKQCTLYYFAVLPPLNISPATALQVYTYAHEGILQCEGLKVLIHRKEMKIRLCENFIFSNVNDFF